jgi:hypothetical protein
MEETAKCIACFDGDGVKNSRQLIAGLSALMGDLAAGRITNGRANAICNAAGKILTTVKLEHQYGQREAGGEGPMLALIGSSDPKNSAATEVGP